MTDNGDILDRIDSLIAEVYRYRTINPWDAGPKRAVQFENLFRKQLADWPLRNQTDLVHGSSTVIAFLLHPGYYIGVATQDGIEIRIRQLGGQCFQALIEISHLGPFARVRFTRETLDNETGGINYEEQEKPYRDEDSHFLCLIEEIFAEQKIETLPGEILQHPVPDIELDVTKRGSATVYHCLFDEE